MMDTPRPDDDDGATDVWLALYHAGEMDDEQRALFEGLMERDPELKFRSECLRDLPPLETLPADEPVPLLLWPPAGLVRPVPAPAPAPAPPGPDPVLRRRAYAVAAAGLLLAAAAAWFLMMTPLAPVPRHGQVPPELNPRGGGGAEPNHGWSIAADLDPGIAGPGPQPAEPAGVATNRDPKLRRHLILNSSRKAWAWAMRVNAETDGRLIQGCHGRLVADRPFTFVPVTAPAAGVDAEWFVVVFLERRGDDAKPPETEAGQIPAKLRAVCQGPRRTTLLQASNQEREDRLQAELAAELSQALGAAVKVAVRHWAIQE
jgi:hypothetical protein